MTREECENRILELVAKIREVALEYNPHEENVSFFLKTDVETPAPLLWTSFWNSASFEESGGNEPFQYDGYIPTDEQSPRECEKLQKGQMKVKDLLPYIESGETVVIVNDDYAKYNADYKRLVENYGEREVKGISAYLNDLYITLEEANLRPTCDQLAT